MTGDRQRRFGVSAQGDAPNVTEFRPTERKPAQEAPKPADAKPGCVLDIIPMKLDPNRFPATITLKLLEPAINRQAQIPVVDDILEDAVRLSLAGDDVTLSSAQWKLLLDMHQTLATVITDLAEGSFGMEWSAALNGMLLLHMLQVGPKEEVERTTDTMNNMLKTMFDFSTKETSDE